MSIATVILSPEGRTPFAPTY